MRKYKRKNLLIFSFVILFIFTLVFFYLLNTVKLWTFNTYNILEESDKFISVLTTKEDVKIFRDNSFFYYNTNKYYYEIESNDSYDEKIILVLKLEKNFRLLEDDRDLLLPYTKKTVLSLIMESWRLKWENLIKMKWRI